MTRVIGYIRVSTEEQAREGLSLAAQRDRITAYCAAMGLDLVRIETDAGVSASTLDREALYRARDAIAQGAASGLVVVKLDRLTRSVRDLVALREDGMGESWSLCSLAENVDTSTATGRMFLTLVVTFAQWERETTAERTRDVLAHARADGQPLGAVPYGWRRVKVRRDSTGRRVGERGRLELDVEAQAIIAMMRTQRAEGRSLEDLARELNECEIKTTRGGSWCAKAVARVLARAA